MKHRLNLICFIWIFLLGVSSIVTSLPANYQSYSNDQSRNVRVLKYQDENDGSGNYRYAFDQSDGTRVEQTGEIKNRGSDHEILTISGQYRWISPEGILFLVRYTADEGGYKADIQQETGLPAQTLPTGQTFYSDNVPQYVASLIG